MTDKLIKGHDYCGNCAQDLEPSNGYKFCENCGWSSQEDDEAEDNE